MCGSPPRPLIRCGLWEPQDEEKSQDVVAVAWVLATPTSMLSILRWDSFK